uniref:Uncharacterized protein n=1 Tax=Anguilla anguilla TaxID=7936 RepID=A0A0E9Q576_ANGAN
MATCLCVRKNNSICRKGLVCSLFLFIEDGLCGQTSSALSLLHSKLVFYKEAFSRLFVVWSEEGQVNLELDEGGGPFSPC